MPDMPRVGAMEIDADLAFQRRDWRVERAGWVVMLALVLAASAGLLGHGPLSDSRVQTAEGSLTVEFDRLTRHSAPTTLRVGIGAGTARDGYARLWFDRAYLSEMQIEAIVPEPESAATADDRFIYTFRVADPGRPAVVSFDLEPRATWLLRGRVGLENGPSLDFGQFIFP